MRVALGGVEREGRALDLRGADVATGTLIAAVRDPADERVACPAPGPVHEYVGHVHPEVALPVRAALAAAARSRGRRAPQDEAIERVESERAGVEVPTAALDGARERVADAGEAERELRERVARLSGRLQARREAGLDASTIEERLDDTARELSEVETERLAAEQRLERERERAREARDARQRRLELADEADNLRRAARTHLAAALHEEFRAAVAAVPGDGDPGTDPSDYDGPAATAALAVARVAALRAPVVVAGDYFADATRAAVVLDAPVALL